MDLSRWTETAVQRWARFDGKWWARFGWTDVDWSCWTDAAMVGAIETTAAAARVAASARVTVSTTRACMVGHETRMAGEAHVDRGERDGHAVGADGYTVMEKAALLGLLEGGSPALERRANVHAHGGGGGDAAAVQLLVRVPACAGSGSGCRGRVWVSVRARARAVSGSGLGLGFGLGPISPNECHLLTHLLAHLPTYLHTYSLTSAALDIQTRPTNLLTTYSTHSPTYSHTHSPTRSPTHAPLPLDGHQAGEGGDPRRGLVGVGLEREDEGVADLKLEDPATLRWARPKTRRSRTRRREPTAG